jgi:hypothetical protein
MRALPNFGRIDGLFVVYAFNRSLILYCNRGYFELAASSYDFGNGETGSYFSRGRIDDRVDKFERDVGEVGTVWSTLFSK